MGFIAFIILGLIAGAIARAILPRPPARWLVHHVDPRRPRRPARRLAGQIVLFNAPLEDFFSIQTWLLAIAGSIIVILIYNALFGSRRARI